MMLIKIIIFIVLNLSVATVDAEEVLLDKTIAEVEKEVITLSDLEIHSRIQIVISEGPESLFKIKDTGFIYSMIILLVNRELIALELKKEKKFRPNLYSKEADTLFIKIRAKFKDIASFQDFLNDLNYTEAELKNTLAIYIMIDDYLNKLAEEKLIIEKDEYDKYLLERGVPPASDPEVINKYKNELKMEKKKNFISNYIEELKNRYRIRYLYTTQ